MVYSPTSPRAMYPRAWSCLRRLLALSRAETRAYGGGKEVLRGGSAKCMLLCIEVVKAEHAGEMQRRK